MIFNTDLNVRRNATYESTIKNLEKAKELLDERFAKKQISNDEYIRQSKEINAKIEAYKKSINGGF